MLKLQATSCRLPDTGAFPGFTALSSFTVFARTRRVGRGLVNLRRVATHAEPKAESPMETHLRMLLVLAGLPRPVDHPAAAPDPAAATPREAHQARDLQP